MRTWSIDSLRIRIPLIHCEILDIKLQEIRHLVGDITGEVYESKLNTSRFISTTGITTTISVTKEPTQWNKLDYHVVILTNSKALKEDYFKGISKNTFKKLYDYIISLGVVKFSYQAFKEAQCTDIDIKSDISCTDSVMRSTFKVFKSNSKLHAEMNRGVKSKWTKTNKMIQYNQRKNTDFMKAPFLKIYAKSLELEFNSGEFVLNHLTEVPQDTWRIEFTIKNKKHLNNLNLPNTFHELACCTQGEYEAAYQTSMRAVLDARIIKASVLSNEISPKDIPVVNVIIRCLDKGDTWSILKNFMLGSLEGANRTKRAIHLQGLFDAYIKPVKAYSNHAQIDSVLEQIGYTF
jgi:hypothetical protein